MTPDPRTDVLVIGAGPVGLTLAGELLRHGVGVRLLDRLPRPLEHPNAAIVHVRTLEILAAMGAVEGFLREGYPLPGIHSRAFGQRLGFIDVGGVDSPYPRPRTIPQQATERLLTGHLARLSGRVERAVEAIALEQDEGEVRVRLRHLGAGNRESTAAAAWVVGCEGSRSLTREACRIPFTGQRYAGKEFLQVDARIRWTHPHGYGYQFIGARHVLFCFPYDAAGFYRIIAARTDQNPDNHEPPSLEEMQAIVREMTEPDVELHGPTWFNRFRSGHRIAGRFREGRAFLAGDAAHVHVPIGGQGMNYGIHDAFNLAWKLAAVIKGDARPALLDTYATERRPADEALVRGTDRGFHLLIQHAATVGTALRFVGSTLLGLPALQHRLRNTLAEVNVAYPASELSEDHGGSSGPAPGDRAPDAEVVRLPECETVRIYEVMHDTRWTLLLFSGLKASVSEVEALERIGSSLASVYGTRVAGYLVLGGSLPVPVREGFSASRLVDREGDLHRRYGVETAPCLYLIRPDWRVAFRGGPEHHGYLVNYLRRILT